MANITRKCRHAKKLAKQAKERASYHIKDKIRFVFSLFATGLPYSSAFLFLLLNNIETFGRSTFYQSQDTVIDTLLDLANRSCKFHFDNMLPNSSVSIDASWAHRRNARQCLVDAIDDHSHKVIDFVFVSKNQFEKAIKHNGSSNMMEYEGLKTLLPRLKNSGKIIRICKDGDVKFNNLFKEMEWKVNISLDTSHRIKNFDTLFRKYNNNSKKKLNGLGKHIKSWLQTCLETNWTTDDKLFYFLNSYNHFLGNHSQCPNANHSAYIWKYRNDDSARISLKQLLSEASGIIAEYIPGVTTSLNENMHSIKARIVPKLYHWGKSWEGRMAASILQYNNPDTWVINAMAALKVTNLTNNVQEKLIKLFQGNKKKNIKSKDPEKVKLSHIRKRSRMQKELKAKKDPHAHK